MEKKKRKETTNIVLFVFLTLISLSALFLAIFYDQSSDTINLQYEQDKYLHNTFTGDISGLTAGYVLTNNVPFTIPFETTVGDLEEYDTTSGIYTVPAEFGTHIFKVDAQAVISVQTNSTTYAVEFSLLATYGTETKVVTKSLYANTSDATGTIFTMDLSAVDSFDSYTRLTVVAESKDPSSTISFLYSTEPLHYFNIVSNESTIINVTTD